MTVLNSTCDATMKSLTDKQSKVYEFINAWQLKNGYPPTQEEIRQHFSFSSLTAVRSHLVLIEKKGYIRLNYGKARGIQMTQFSAPVSQRQEEAIPLLGSIAAGIPIWAEQNVEEQLPIPPSLFGGGELFALRVTGDSMSGGGIKNGDIAVIQKRSDVDNGEIAAVLIGNEATLKRVYSAPDSVVLKADNPAFADLVYTADEGDAINILGQLQGIIRTKNNRYWS